MEDLLLLSITKFGVPGAVIAYLLWAGARRDKAWKDFVSNLTRDEREDARERIKVDVLMAANLGALTEIIRSSKK